MKAPKLVLASIALCMSLAAFSQTDTTKRDTTTRRDTTQRRDTASYSIQNSPATTDDVRVQSQSNTSGNQPQTSLDQSQAGTIKQTFRKPNSGRYYIAVLGTYQASQPKSSNISDERSSITITSDETNKGKIWIEGLTPVKFYALLKTSPGTYKIPAQKQEEKNILEGTVAYDDNSKQINICVGCGYQDGNISETTATTESVAKSKKTNTKSNNKTIINFSGTKREQGTVSNQF